MNEPFGDVSVIFMDHGSKLYVEGVRLQSPIATTWTMELQHAAKIPTHAVDGWRAVLSEACGQELQTEHYRPTPIQTQLTQEMGG